VSGKDIKANEQPVAAIDYLERRMRCAAITPASAIGPDGRSIAFQMAEVMVPRMLFAKILRLIAALRPSPPPARC